MHTQKEGRMYMKLADRMAITIRRHFWSDIMTTVYEYTTIRFQVNKEYSQTCIHAHQPAYVKSTNDIHN